MKKKLLRTKDMFLILLMSLQLNTCGKMLKQSNIYDRMFDGSVIQEDVFHYKKKKKTSVYPRQKSVVKSISQHITCKTWEKSNFFEKGQTVITAIIQAENLKIF